MLAAAFLAAKQPAVQPVTVQQGSLGAKARHEICYMLATGAAYLKLADCLSFDNAPEPVFRAEVCNFLRETDQLRDFGFASHSDCNRYRFVR